MRDQAFYATAAQVIPVLLIVLGLERRLFSVPTEDTWWRVFSFVLVYYVATAEIAAVTALLALEDWPDFWRWFVWGAIAVEMAALVFTITPVHYIFGRQQGDDQPEKDPGS